MRRPNTRARPTPPDHRVLNGLALEGREDHLCSHEPIGDTRCRGYPAHHERRDIPALGRDRRKRRGQRQRRCNVEPQDADARGHDGASLPRRRRARCWTSEASCFKPKTARSAGRSLCPVRRRPRSRCDSSLRTSVWQSPRWHLPLRTRPRRPKGLGRRVGEARSAQGDPGSLNQATSIKADRIGASREEADDQFCVSALAVARTDSARGHRGIRVLVLGMASRADVFPQKAVSGRLGIPPVRPPQLHEERPTVGAGLDRCRMRCIKGAGSPVRTERARADNYVATTRGDSGERQKHANAQQHGERPQSPHKTHLSTVHRQRTRNRTSGPTLFRRLTRRTPIPSTATSAAMNRCVSGSLGSRGDRNTGFPDHAC